MRRVQARALVANAVPQPNAAPAQTFSGGLTSHALALGMPAQSQVSVPQTVLAAQQSNLVAKVTIQDPPSAHGFSFNVFVNPPQDTSGLNDGQPQLCGDVAVFRRAPS